MARGKQGASKPKCSNIPPISSDIDADCSDYLDSVKYFMAKLHNLSAIIKK